jgi:hypothetical protein
MRKFMDRRSAVFFAGVGVILLARGRITLADFTFGPATRVPNVNSTSSEGVPDISADGLELYFKSNRPYGADLCFSDLWVARRTSSGESWREPERLSLPISTIYPEAAPCISSDGLELYFSDGYPGWLAGCGLRPEGYGRGDLWVSRRDAKDGDWSTPVNLGPVVNTSNWEGCPSISPDSLSLFFCSDRPGGFQAADLYVSTRQTVNDPWGPPVNLGAAVNRMKWQTRSEISPDGLLLFFSAGTDQMDMFVSRRASPSDSWGMPVNLGSAVNTPKDEHGLALSADCSTVYFTRGEIVHLQPSPNLATYDIWQASVLPIVDFNGDGVVNGLDVSALIDHWGTDNSLYDIGPTPFGDGVVDAQDLIVLAGHLFEDHRLIAHWKLDEATGQIASDSAGGHDASVFGGAIWEPVGGKVGGALSLDGTDDYVATDFVLSPADGAFSAFAWVKSSMAGRVILSQKKGENWLAADAVGGRLMTTLRNPAGRVSVPPLVSDAMVTDEQWHHVGLVWNGANRLLYVDGTEVARDTQAAPGDSSGGLHIGCDAGCTVESFWWGLIDDVRVYHAALAEEEIIALYAAEETNAAG